MHRMLIALSLLLLTGCAAQQPQITIRSIEPKTPPPQEAVRHYIRARIAEMKGHRDRAIYELASAVRYDTTSATLYADLARNLNARGRFSEAVDPAGRAVYLADDETENRWQYYHALMKGAHDTVQALSQLRAIVRLDGKNLAAYDQMLQIYSTQKQEDDVLHTLDRIVTLNLGPRERLIAAQNYVRYGAPKRAEALYRDIIRQEPDNMEARLELGVSQLRRADTLAAKATFNEALSHTGNEVTRENARIWGQMVRIYRQPNHLNALLQNPSTNARLITNLSKVFLDMARDPKLKQEEVPEFYRLGERLLDVAINNDPENQHLLASKAQLLLETERPRKARDYFRRANRQEEKAEYYIGIAHTHMAEGNWGNALKLLEKLHNMAPTNAKTYPEIVSNLARLYMRLDETEKARAVYRKAAEALPDRPVYRYEMARTFVIERKWADAIPLLETLKDETEDKPGLFQAVLFDLGHSYERAGHYEKAVNVFERLLLLNPKNDDANNYLGYMLAERGERLLEAKTMIERALEAEPQNGAYLDSMGWVYYQLGQYDEAMKWLSKAIAIEEDALRKSDPNDKRQRNNLYENLAVIHEHAGDAARAIGNLAGARLHYKRALEFDPDNQGIRDKLQELASGNTNTSGSR